MRVVVAPDSFKGSLSAKEVAACFAVGFKRILPEAEVVQIPMADGGEGTVQSLVEATGGHVEEVTVTGPLNTPVRAFYGILGDGDTALIEMAAASGLPLVPAGKLDPRMATTTGTGELLLAAARRGCRKAIIGIGGSATNDGGAGMAQAVGIRLLDAFGQDLSPGGAALARLHRIEMDNLDPKVKAMEITVACDVENPLCGPTGASAIYGPQKGATPEVVAELDAALAHYAAIIEEQLGVKVQNVSGAGAAGGLGAGLIVFLGAKLRRGVDVVIDAVQLESAVASADLVVTGEGAVDSQTAFGKTPAGVGRVARKYGKPLIVIAGGVADDADQLHQTGFGPIFSIVKRPMDLAEASLKAPRLVESLAEQIARCLLIGVNSVQVIAG